MKHVLKKLRYNPMSSISLLGYAWHAGINFTKFVLRIIQELQSFLMFEKAICVELTGYMGARFAVFEENNEIVYLYASN